MKQASIRPRLIAITAALSGFVAMPSYAASVYVALGDSITFGETDLVYQPSLGDRGYVAGYADALAARAGGVRPTVVNLAIDGETASSFTTGVGRTPPVVGRTDMPLALENMHYIGPSPVTQSALFASTVASQQALGNSVDNVTITLGFNEVAALSTLPPAEALADVPATLATYTTNYASVLTQVRDLLPTAHLSLLGYYNPFPADPTSPAAAIFNAAGMQLNTIIQHLASAYGASFVDTATPFVGHEAAYTYLDEMPAGTTVAGAYGGVEPIGNVHPNAIGYGVIAAQVAAVPEPASWALMAVGLVGVSSLCRRKRWQAPMAA